MSAVNRAPFRACYVHFGNGGVGSQENRDDAICVRFVRSRK
jgi:hypothetical protein